MRPFKTFQYLLILMLCSCTTSPLEKAQKASADMVAEIQRQGNTVSPEEEAKLKELNATAFSGMFEYCQSTLSTYEHSANTSKKWGYALAIIGVTAGSVVVPVLVAAAPIANAAAIAGLSAVSGATNSFQAALSQYGLNGDQILATRQGIASRLNEIFNQYIEASKEPDVKKRYERMHIELEHARFACMVRDITKVDPKTTQESPRIKSIPDATVKAGQEYIGPTPEVTGAQPIEWELVQGIGGMTIDERTGVVRLSSAPTGGTSFLVIIRAKNAAGISTETWKVTTIN